MLLKEILNEAKGLLKPFKNYILNKYNEKKITQKLDDEILNWVDSDWKEQGYLDEYEWYSEFGRGEAEDSILNDLTIETEKVIKVKLNADNEIKFQEWLQDKYKFLEYK